MRKQPKSNETTESDSPTVWFAVLERARLTQDYPLADRAKRELERLGVVVKFTAAGDGKAVAHA